MGKNPDWKDPGKLISRNLMEIIVLDKLKEVGDSLECCRCEHCMLDIATYVLNRLPPKYVATTRGDIFSHLEMLSAQYTASILTLVMEASRLISGNPRHLDC